MDTIKWDIIIVLRALVQECVYKRHVNIEYDIYVQCTVLNNVCTQTKLDCKFREHATAAMSLLL